MEKNRGTSHVERVERVLIVKILSMRATCTILPMAIELTKANIMAKGCIVA